MTKLVSTGMEPTSIRKMGTHPYLKINYMRYNDSICKTIYNFFRFRMNLGRATRPLPLPLFSEEVQKDWERIGAEIEAIGDSITAEQLNAIFNSGKKDELKKGALQLRKFE